MWLARVVTFRLVKVTTCSEAKEIADSMINRKTIVSVIGIDVTSMVGIIPRRMTQWRVELLQEQDE